MVKCEKMYRTTDCILKHAQIYQNVVKRNKVHEMYRTECPQIIPKSVELLEMYKYSPRCKRYSKNIPKSRSHTENWPNYV